MSTLVYTWKEQPSPPSLMPKDSAISQKLTEYLSTAFDLRASLAAAPPLESGPALTPESGSTRLGIASGSVPTKMDQMHEVDVPQATAELAATSALETEFVFENRAEVTEFIQRNRLAGLLFQAVQPLLDAFGTEVIKILRVVRDDEGSESLFCLVSVRTGLAEAQLALESFDERWWLARCALKAGLLNFDFDLV